MPRTTLLSGTTAPGVESTPDRPQAARWASASPYYELCCAAGVAPSDWLPDPAPNATYAERVRRHRTKLEIAELSKRRALQRKSAAKARRTRRVPTRIEIVHALILALTTGPQSPTALRFAVGTSDDVKSVVAALIERDYIQPTAEGQVELTARAWASMPGRIALDLYS